MPEILLKMPQRMPNSVSRKPTRMLCNMLLHKRTRAQRALTWRRDVAADPHCVAADGRAEPRPGRPERDAAERRLRLQGARAEPARVRPRRPLPHRP